MLHLVLALILGPAPSKTQDSPPVPATDENPVSVEDPKHEWLASDGEPATPGRIPEDATPEAVELWRRLTEATRGSQRVPLTGLDISIELHLRSPGKFNEVDAVFQFLSHPRGPFLKASFEREDRISLRGPRGDFLIESGQPEPMLGESFLEDRRNLDQWSSIAGNFLTLAQPEQVRLLELKAHKVQPEAGQDGEPSSRVLAFTTTDDLLLPDVGLAQQARKLEWLEIRSPDFALMVAPARRQKPVYRALLGLDLTTAEIRMAILNEDRDQTIVLESALLVLVRGHTTIDPGYRVPSNLEVRQVDPTSSPWTFERRSGTTLYLKKGGRLNPPELRPGSFIPD